MIWRPLRSDEDEELPVPVAEPITQLSDCLHIQQEAESMALEELLESGETPPEKPNAIMEMSASSTEDSACNICRSLCFVFSSLEHLEAIQLVSQRIPKSPFSIMIEISGVSVGTWHRVWSLAEFSNSRPPTPTASGPCSL